MSHDTSPAANFDHIARIYRWAEYLSLGRMLVCTRNHFLPMIAHRRCALVLGDGDGRFLACLMRQNPGLQALAVDTSRVMLQLLLNRCMRGIPSANRRLQTQHTSALNVTPSEEIDLIVSHFFLDCLAQTEVDSLTKRLAVQVPPGTLWLISDFGTPRPRVLRPFAAVYIRVLYLGFHLLTGLRTTHLPDTESSLTCAGFRRIARHDRLFGLLYTELWQRH